jgi:hypothetical protein
VDALFEVSGRFMRMVVQEGTEGSSRQLISPDRHMVAAGWGWEGVVLWVHEPVALNLSQRRGVGSDSERGRDTTCRHQRGQSDLVSACIRVTRRRGSSDRMHS